jgi:hypothetical protein
MIGSQSREDFSLKPYFFGGDGTEDTHLKVYCIGINEIFGFIYLASLAVHCVSLPGSKTVWIFSRSFSGVKGFTI